MARRRCLDCSLYLVRDFLTCTLGLKPTEGRPEDGSSRCARRQGTMMCSKAMESPLWIVLLLLGVSERMTDGCKTNSGGD